MPPPGASVSDPKTRHQVGRMREEQKVYIKEMEARHEAEIADYAASINRTKEAILQQMPTRRRNVAPRERNSWNMELSLFAAICHQNGIVMSQEALMNTVRDRRQARKNKSEVAGDGGHMEVDAGDGDEWQDEDGGDLVFKDDEDIRATFESVQQQYSDQLRQTGDVAGTMQRMVNQLSKQVGSSSSRVASQLSTYDSYSSQCWMPSLESRYLH